MNKFIKANTNQVFLVLLQPSEINHVTETKPDVKDQPILDDVDEELMDEILADLS
jgi:hypothetical protein